MPETAPVDAEAAYEDARSVPLSEAWRLLDPAPVPQDRMEAVKAHLRAATLAVLAMPYPPRPGDKPLLLSWELVQRALDHPSVDLSLPSDELVTGNSRHGGLHFILCRAIRSEHMASVQPVPGENEPVSRSEDLVSLAEGLGRVIAMTETFQENLNEAVNAARDEFRAKSGPEIPPADLTRLCEVLVTMFVEDPAWEKAGNESLGYNVASRDPRFRHNHGAPRAGRWNKATLEQRIKEIRPEAKYLAESRRQEDLESY